MHVARQHHEVRPVFLNQGVDGRFRRSLVLVPERDYTVRNAIKISALLVVGMIGNDQWDVTGEFATLLPVQQVHQTVIIFGDENDHAWPVGRLGQPPFHTERVSNRREVFGEIG